MRKFNICYAGNFGFDNYIDDLLNLISKINSNEFFFHFIGDGSQKKILQNKFSHLKNINFYNSVNYTDLHSILIKMDCLILSFGFNINNYNDVIELKKVKIDEDLLQPFYSQYHPNEIFACDLTEQIANDYIKDEYKEFLNSLI